MGRRLFLLSGLLALSLASGAAEPKPEAVIAGTVFRTPGFVLPGAEIELKVVTAAPKGLKRGKTLRAVSDARGEFAFHVPAGKAEYTLSVKAQGFVGQDKPVAINDDERTDIYFELVPNAAK